MAVTPLTAAQQRTVDTSSRRAGSSEFRSTSVAARPSWGRLRRRWPTCRTSGTRRTRYNLAYDAAHDVGEAMLAAYGYRTAHGTGQHDSLGRFLPAVFDTPPENAASRHYDRMRRDRNRQRDNAQPITIAAAVAAADAATLLFQAWPYSASHPSSDRSDARGAVVIGGRSRGTEGGLERGTSSRVKRGVSSCWCRTLPATSRSWTVRTPLVLSTRAKPKGNRTRDVGEPRGDVRALTEQGPHSDSAPPGRSRNPRPGGARSNVLQRRSVSRSS